MQEIKIGSIIKVDNNGEDKEYQVIDNSEISSEYPVAILDLDNYKIVQTSCKIDYMNLGNYVYIDDEYKEYKIIDVGHPKETLKEKAMRQGYFNKTPEQKIKEMDEFLNNPNRLQLDSNIMLEELDRIRGKDVDHYKD